MRRGGDHLIRRYNKSLSVHEKICLIFSRKPQNHGIRFRDIGEFFSMVKVAISPPRCLLHPVLPYIYNGRIKFPLCRSCAEAEASIQCTCDDWQRVITGTWCTPELDKVVEKGYVITKTCEVLQFDQTIRYDPARREGGLSF